MKLICRMHKQTGFEASTKLVLPQWSLNSCNPMSTPSRILLLFLILPIFLLFFVFFNLPIQHTHAQEPFFHSSKLVNNPFPPPPRIAYFITGTNDDGPRMFRLLQAAYHPRNYYLLHLDQLAPRGQRSQLAQMVASVEVFVAAGNVNVVEKVDAVNEEGSSPLALVLHGAAILLRWKKDWDWFVNLDASDYPLIPPDDLLHVMSFVPRDFNFIEHTTNATSEEDERMVDVIVDPRLYLSTKGKMFLGNKKRPEPDAFKLFSGSPHAILSREFIHFSVLGWDNFPRTLLLYFSNTRSSHRSYFHTLACNSEGFSQTVINSNLRFVQHDDAHKEDLQQMKPMEFKKMIMSGAAFVGNVPVQSPVRDMIDSLVLHRGRDLVSPGGWCLGRSGWSWDTCRQWGDLDVLKPGPASKRLETLLLRLIMNTSFRKNP